MFETPVARQTLVPTLRVGMLSSTLCVADSGPKLASIHQAEWIHMTLHCNISSPMHNCPTQLLSACTATDWNRQNSSLCASLPRFESSGDRQGPRSVAFSVGRFAFQFEEVYSAHNGFVLYKDLLSDAAGIERCQLRNGTRPAKTCANGLSHLAAEEDPDRICSGIAFANVPQSGNYFVVPVEGPNAGKIFYANHDGWYEAPFEMDLMSLSDGSRQIPQHCCRKNWGVIPVTPTARLRFSGFRRALASDSKAKTNRQANKKSGFLSAIC